MVSAETHWKGKILVLLADISIQILQELKIIKFVWIYIGLTKITKLKQIGPYVEFNILHLPTFETKSKMFPASHFPKQQQTNVCRFASWLHICAHLGTRLIVSWLTRAELLGHVSMTKIRHQILIFLKHSVASTLYPLYLPGSPSAMNQTSAFTPLGEIARILYPMSYWVDPFQNYNHRSAKEMLVTHSQCSDMVIWLFIL